MNTELIVAICAWGTSRQGSEAELREAETVDNI